MLGCMADLHVRPARLREHACAATTLADELYAVARRLPADGRAEVDELRGLLTRAVGELAELGGALVVAAATAEHADAAAAAVLRRAGDRP